MTHPEPDQLLLLTEGRIQDPALAAHVEGCAECQHEIEVLKRPLGFEVHPSPPGSWLGYEGVEGIRRKQEEERSED